MKIFILEDNELRIKTFKAVFASHNITFSSNVEEAKKLYKEKGEFDLIMLDHDLDGRVYVPSEEPNTGYQFAKFLRDEKTKSVIIVHSMNKKGASNILKELPTAHAVPFPYLFS